MYATVKRIRLDPKKRILVTSDIHGNLARFQALLDRVGYTREDILIIVGDMIEKGPQSLATVRFIRSLAENAEVHIVKGNCDDFSEAIDNNYEDEEIRDYMIHRKNSILNEMCDELGFHVHQDMDVREMKHEIKERFHDILHFLNVLPEIIETDDYIFVHAGLEAKPLDQQDIEYVLTTKAFLDQGIRCPKPTFVGHWPVSLYEDREYSLAVRVDHALNVVAIDGGNVLKSFGQLNMVILKDREMEFVSQDEFPLVELLESALAASAPVHTIKFPYQDITVLETAADFSYCRHHHSRQELWIPNEFIYEGSSSIDYTDQQLSLDKGTICSLIKETSRGSYVKYQGDFGWITVPVREIT